MKAILHTYQKLIIDFKSQLLLFLLLCRALLKDILHNLVNVAEQGHYADHCGPFNNTFISSVLTSAKGFLYSESSTDFLCFAQ